MRFCINDLPSDLTYRSRNGQTRVVYNDLDNILLKEIDFNIFEWYGFIDGIEFEITEDMGDMKIFHRDVLIREYCYPMDYIKCFFEACDIQLNGVEKTLIKEIITCFLKLAEENNDS